MRYGRAFGCRKTELELSVFLHLLPWKNAMIFEGSEEEENDEDDNEDLTFAKLLSQDGSKTTKEPNDQKNFPDDVRPFDADLCSAKWQQMLRQGQLVTSLRQGSEEEESEQLVSR
ncbi:unnamed protein product [Larinioides sclopetarius]|uniref:Uncharacterized protein n=1 Tax=Larinioides sclopetarius TaxID=280406 RepID=A0AAV2B577_9ARAC